MYPEKSVKPGRIGPRLAASFCFLLLVLVSAPFALAQDAPANNQELSVSDILKMPGRVIGQSRATRAAGQFKVKDYVVEEVSLPRPKSVEIGGRSVEVTKAFRVSLTGGPFPVRAMPPVVWVDDVALGYGVESEDLTSVTVVTFDRSLLRDGATLYLSYGDRENKEDRTPLPEKLSLGGAKGGQ